MKVFQRVSELFCGPGFNTEIYKGHSVKTVSGVRLIVFGNCLLCHEFEVDDQKAINLSVNRYRFDKAAKGE